MCLNSFEVFGDNQVLYESFHPFLHKWLELPESYLIFLFLLLFLWWESYLWSSLKIIFSIGNSWLIFDLIFLSQSILFMQKIISFSIYYAQSLKLSQVKSKTTDRKRWLWNIKFLVTFLSYSDVVGILLMGQIALNN